MYYTYDDGSQIKNDYKIEKGLLKTTVTDPKGNRKISYQDMRDNLLKIEQFNGGKMITTRYEYDLLKQITAVIDTQGNRTHITYDSLGRRTSINNADSGLIEYFFDINGNLIKKTDPNLRKKSAGILYTYQYNRLMKIDYPDKKDVEYSYGAPGAVNNTAGRLLSITDESGSTTFEYGLLGEQTRISKTLNRLAPSAPQLTYESSYGFDYLGRMEWIRYPDKETVYYEYDRGGQVRSVYGEHRGTRFDYVKKIHYDSFGQRVYLKYGNDVETRYRYDEQRRWLSELNTINGEGKVFQALDYTFDKAGNILIMENSAALKTSRQEFAYDDLYQLTGAKGIYWDKTSAAQNRRNEYTQTYVYDDIGNLTHKTSYNYKWPDNSKPEHLNYNLAYHYAAAHPHRATRIGEMYYTYDGNGNVIRISDKAGDGQNSSNTNSDTFKPPMDTGANTGWAGVAYGREPGGSGGNEQTNQYKWDEENRLIHAKVNGSEIDFLYNAGGERTAKYGKDGEVIYYDKMFQVKTNVSPLHITKHIFLGSTRVVSKLSHELGPIDLEYEKRNAYYYHGDHLGSSNYMTDYEGNEYEHYEYTPFGEMWVEEESDSLDKINFKFTSKELDEETGLYYFGVRYLDAKVSRWLSCDPILNEYLDGKPAGGVFNPVNLNLYQYCANSPLKYTDPNGLFQIDPNTATRLGIDIMKTGVEGMRQAAQYAQSDGPTIGPGDGIGVVCLIVAGVVIIVGGGIWVYGQISDAGNGNHKNNQKNQESHYENKTRNEQKLQPQPAASGAGAMDGPPIDLDYFYNLMYSVSVNERIPMILDLANKVAKQNGWVKNSKVGKINGNRTVFHDPINNVYYSVDTQHGRFEMTNKRGKHLGEYDFNLNQTKPADPSGKHDLIIK